MDMSASGAHFRALSVYLHMYPTLRRVFHSPTNTIMPSSDYTSAVGGGLKLKGSSSGIDKKKKKKKSSSKPLETTNTETKADELEGEGAGGESASQTALQKALADEEAKDAQIAKPLADTGFGKTEAQRRHEERRKKRVSFVIHVVVVLEILTDATLSSSTSDSRKKVF